MSWGHFPPEILAKIFSYLPVHELKTASDVSKQWCDIASNLVLVPKGHLLSRRAPLGIWKTPLHTIHVDGCQDIREDFKHIRAKFSLADVTTIALYGRWTVKGLTELSKCMDYMPQITTLEILNVFPAKFVVDFLLIRHCITKVRCFLRTSKQLRPYHRLCDRFRGIHGLFEEIILSIEINKQVQVYAPKTQQLKYPEMRLTSSLTIHPAQMSSCDFNAIQNLELMECLTLNFPKEIPKDIMTNLLSSPATLKKLVLYNAKSISYECWLSFFQSPLVASLEELFISGKSQIDSTIFDSLENNYSIKKLYIQLNSPCFSDECRIKTMLTWCPNVEILVLSVPFSSVGLVDLMNVDKEHFKRLRILNVLFQLTPDMEEPYKEHFLEYGKHRIKEKLQKLLPRVAVTIGYKTHLHEFLCDDNDDFD